MNWKNNFSRKKKTLDLNKEKLKEMVLHLDDDILKNIKEKCEEPPETFKHLGVVWSKQEDGSYRFREFI